MDAWKGNWVRGRLGACLALGLVTCLGGCASQRSLLENASVMPGNGAPLTAPPSDALAKADPSVAPNQDNDDGGATPGVPTLNDISAMGPQFDIGKYAADVDAERQASPAGNVPLWSGKFTPEGVDIVNAGGVLCSAPGQRSPQVVACSDGRLGTFSYPHGGMNGQLSFGADLQIVRLDREP